MITANEARRKSFETIDTSMLERIESEIIAAAERGSLECDVEIETVSKYSDVTRECLLIEDQLTSLCYCVEINITPAKENVYRLSFHIMW